MKTKVFCWCLLITIFLVSCEAQFSTSTSITTSEPLPSTKTAITFSTLELTPQSTITPSHATTPTPLPTLSVEERDKLVLELLATNSACSTPCFWGIVPGKDNWDDAIAFLKSLGSRGIEGSKNSIFYYNATLNYKNKILIGLVLMDTNGKVGEINASVDGLQREGISDSDWLAFRPDNVIRTYGTPSSIKIALSQGPEGLVSYFLLFTFNAAKLSILYYPIDGGGGAVSNPVLHACPLVKQGISRFDLWLGRIPDSQDYPVIGLHDIHELTTLTVGDFSKLLIEKTEAACFDISLKELNNH